MLDSELSNIELLIDNLAIENSSLRKEIIRLNRDYLALSDKNKKAAVSLKKIIMQLQDELACQIQ